MAAPVVTGGLMARFGGPGLFATCAAVLLGLGLYAIRRILLGPVVPVETRDKFVPVATISPSEPQMHPREPVARREPEREHQHVAVEPLALTVAP